MTASGKHNQDRADEIIGYLLGEFTAAERAALEERFFADDEWFAQMEECENDLIHDYARGYLSAAQRRQFEQNYLAHPDRRARVQFMTALAQALPEPKPSWWERWRAAWSSFHAPLAFAAMAALLLLALGGLWLWQETRRLRQDLQQTQLARANEQRRAQEMQQTLTVEQQRNAALTTELEQMRASQPTTTPTPSLTQDILTLELLATGSRTTNPAERPPELTISPSAKQVRLQVRLPKNEYARYQATLERVGGNVIWTQKNLPARGTRLAVVVPARRFTNGDYILTLSGVAANGELDQVAQPFFRVWGR